MYAVICIVYAIVPISERIKQLFLPSLLLLSKISHNCPPPTVTQNQTFVNLLTLLTLCSYRSDIFKVSQVLSSPLLLQQHFPIFNIKFSESTATNPLTHQIFILLILCSLLEPSSNTSLGSLQLRCPGYRHRTNTSLRAPVTLCCGYLFPVCPMPYAEYFEHNSEVLFLSTSSAFSSNKHRFVIH